MRSAEVLDLLRQGWTLSRKAPPTNGAAEPFVIQKGGTSRRVPTEVVVSLVGRGLIAGGRTYKPVRYYDLTRARGAWMGTKPGAAPEPEQEEDVEETSK